MCHQSTFVVRLLRRVWYDLALDECLSQKLYKSGKELKCYVFLHVGAAIYNESESRHAEITLLRVQVAAFSTRNLRLHQRIQGILTTRVQKLLQLLDLDTLHVCVEMVLFLMHLIGNGALAFF